MCLGIFYNCVTNHLFHISEFQNLTKNYKASIIVRRKFIFQIKKGELTKCVEVKITLKIADYLVNHLIGTVSNIINIRILGQ